MSEEVKDIYLLHRNGQDKYTYFLLAAAASALAFAIQKTVDASFSWSMLPLAGAAVSWGLSFFFGCKNVSWVLTALYANVGFLQLKSGTHPNQPAHPQEVAAAISGVRNALDHNAEKAYLYAKWQFRMLITGGILFIGWHVLEMYFRTIAE
jgi:uncharacterized membrane protein (DUF485 family)